MVRATLLLNLLVLAGAIAILAGVDWPDLPALRTGAERALGWLADGIGRAAATLDRAFDALLAWLIDRFD